MQAACGLKTGSSVATATFASDAAAGEVRSYGKQSRSEAPYLLVTFMRVGLARGRRQNCHQPDN
jgi:hypothetical protein